MTNKNYNHNITKMLVGSLKGSYPIGYFFGYPLLFLFTFLYWSLFIFFENLNDNSVVIFSLISSSLFLILFITILFGSNKLGVITCDEEIAKSLNATAPILDFIPIEKETLVVSQCLDRTLLYLMFLIPVSSLYLAVTPSKYLIVFKGFVLILSLSTVGIMTYRNTTTFKAVSKIVIKEKKKPKSKVKAEILSFLKFFVFITIVRGFIEIVTYQTGNFYDSIRSFVESISVLSFFGDIYVGLSLILIATIAIIYFNYFYLIKKKEKDIATVSSWREL